MTSHSTLHTPHSTLRNQHSTLALHTPHSTLNDELDAARGVKILAGLVPGGRAVEVRERRARLLWWDHTDDVAGSKSW